ncbi:TIGR03067 domain-containing protein [Gemmata sp. G18]|uniref:TIGR03067 domain-containing protein n=1 Tax=Gemmata palustris TaxID=2822762 RepID=A0ABS5BU22_9BACT|nr:TIGR03067 domain-containing protein [Gemmata palustris]MBP3957211.1 TIGR03067 domain-containing protein [Gemmata palustris]
MAAVAGVVAVAVWYFAIRTPEPRDDFGRFQGEWKLTVADRAKQAPITVRVSGDKWTWLVGGTDQKRYAMALRPDTSPKEIDLTQLAPDDSPQQERRDGKFVPVVLRGIYTVEGDKVKVVTAPNPHPRPTAFDATDGPPVWVLELQGR